MMYTEDSKRWAVDGSLQRAEGRGQRAAGRRPKGRVELADSSHNRSARELRIEHLRAKAVGKQLAVGSRQ